ncbi:MAG TPA: acyl-CoA dehydrogenase [Ilumatobacter sp.]|nr:acyl-CoA dehydrogenase [Ilumatobacter sp.]
MHFGFTDEQRLLEDVVADVLRSTCTTAAIRAAADAAPGALDRGIWSALCDIGLADALVSVDAGGLGLDERDLVLVLEQAGRFAVPLPLVESVLVAPGLIDGHTSGIGAGTLFATDLGGSLVAYGADADRLLLRQPMAEAVHLYAAADVTFVERPAVDRARRLVEIVGIDAGDPLTSDAAVIERAVARGVFGNAAMLVGLAQRMLDMTVEYVAERRQFGVPIGSFQAVKHHCADALKAISFARPVVQRAAWSLATNAPTQRRDVAMAKAVAGTAAVQVGRLALQCHGAIAYTVEYDLHLFLKRAEALEAAWGNSAVHRRTVAESIGVVTQTV